MRSLLLSLTLVFTAAALAQGAANYRILEGKLHRGGSARVEVVAGPGFTVRMSYELVKKPLVPVPSDALKGESTVELPELFRDERGYLELEAKGRMSVPDAELRFVRRAKWGAHSDAYLIEVLPENGRSRIEALYHPTVAGAGWAQVKVIFISKVPLLNGYVAEMHLR